MHFLPHIILGLAAAITTVCGDPQGVYDIVKPKASSPKGCVPTVNYRFGIMPREAPSGAKPNGSMMTVCDAPNKLSMNLRNGILTDKQGSIGSIVANRQFQFDGPPAQAGAIYTGGWSICPEIGVLALGDQILFYRCLSGDCEYLNPELFLVLKLTNFSVSLQHL